MAGRLTLLLSSPRVAAGLLTREAWQALEQADLVMGREGEPQVEAIVDSGLLVTSLEALTEREEPPTLGRDLVHRAYAGAQVVWVGSADGDPGLTDVVATEVSRLTDAPEVEVVLGSHDVPGARLLDLVAVMDRLRSSPGGCPWDREQTHLSLVPFLVEEAHEAAEALESGDRQHMVEELGDVLLQVAFHARLGEEDPQEPFDIDDVAAAIVAKLVRRHPHVFADGDATSAAEVETSWESIKAGERAEVGADVDAALLDGIPVAMPPLARAAKVVSRLRRAGRSDLLPDAAAADEPGQQLLAFVAELTASGIDPDAALRAALRQLESLVRG